MIELERRRIATQKTFDEWRGRTFDWSDVGTCGHLLHDHLKNMGHTPPAVPQLDDALGALRAIRALGYDNLEALLDGLLPRRPSVSSMRLGDVSLAPGEGPFDAVFICAGPLKLFGWHETRDDLVVMDVRLEHLKGAWQT